MYNNDIAIENFIAFCDDMMIAEEGTQLDAFKIYISSDFKNMKRKFKEGKKLEKSIPTLAIEKLLESKDAAYELKEKVSKLPKDNSKILKYLSYINPILLFINSEEVTGATVIANNVVLLTKEYYDSYSKKSANRVHEKVQTALNLYIKRINDHITNIKNKNK